MNESLFHYYDSIRPPETLLPRLLALEPKPQRRLLKRLAAIPIAACFAILIYAASLLLAFGPEPAPALSTAAPQLASAAPAEAPPAQETAALQQTLSPQEPEHQPVMESGEAIFAAIEEYYYEHTDHGDYLTLVLRGAESVVSETIDITGQIVDGQYVGYTHLNGTDNIIYLTVHEDGTYDVRFEGVPKPPQELLPDTDREPVLAPGE